jgi:hypothetical protein
VKELQMERPLIAGPHVELPEVRPRRGGGGWLKAAAFILVPGAVIAGVAYFAGAGALLSAPSPEEQRQTADELAVIYTSQVALYMLQHNDAVPDFGKYPKWEQLTGTTDRAGNLVAAGGSARVVGPYMQKAPTNPTNGMDTVAVAPSRVRPGDPTPGGRIVGWVFERAKARVHPTNDVGTRVVGTMPKPRTKR